MDLGINADGTVMGDLLPEEEIARLVAIAESVAGNEEDDVRTVCTYEEQPLPPPVASKVVSRPALQKPASVPPQKVASVPPKKIASVPPQKLAIPECETVLDRRDSPRRASPKPARGVDALPVIPPTRDSVPQVEDEISEELEPVVPQDLDKSDRCATLGPPTAASLPAVRPVLEDPTAELQLPASVPPKPIDELKALSALCGIGMDETIGPEDAAQCIDYEDSFIVGAHAEISAIEESLGAEDGRDIPATFRPGFHDVAPQRYIRTQVTPEPQPAFRAKARTPVRRHDTEDPSESPRFAIARGPTYLLSSSPEPTSKLFPVLLCILLAMAASFVVFFQTR